ncbi:MAG: zinc-dependent metalloprotease [Bacteroidota bacterium]
MLRLCCVSLCLIIFFLTYQMGQAQTATCVTPHLDQMKDRLQHNQSMNWTTAQPEAIQYVPLKFHLVADDNGQNRIPDIQVLDMLCILNDTYEDQEIQFYFLDGTFNYINDTDIHQQPNSQTNALKNHRIANAINIFITESTGITGGAGYYQLPAGWNGNDFIVVARSFAYNQNVLPHEIGHFFSLLHPFHGWENNPWNLSDWGSPVGTFAPSDPTLFPSDVLNERQDGSNCSTAADLICDTPPDYLFAQHPSQSGCNNWNIAVLDPANTLVDPMENNIMSYFNNCGSYIFTNGQKTAIVNDLLFSPDRSYVRSNYTPDLTLIEEVPTLVFPANGSAVPSADQVVLSWIPVLTADFYVVEIDATPSFTSNLAQSKVVSASVPSAIFEQLAGNTQYFWRVRPFAEYVTCTGLSDRWSFTTPASTAVKELEAVEAMQMVPNPASTSSPLLLELQAKDAFSARIHLYDWSGQLLYQSGDRRFVAASQTYELPYILSEPGMYILQIQNEQGSSSRKFVRF